MQEGGCGARTARTRSLALLSTTVRVTAAMRDALDRSYRCASARCFDHVARSIAAPSFACASAIFAM